MTFPLEGVPTSAPYGTRNRVGRYYGPRPRKRPYERLFKRVFDIAAVLVTLPFTVPLVVIMALLVALDGKSPFYGQLRVGRAGHAFRMVKIRTMVPNADELLTAHLAANPDARREWERTQKLKDDPRITSLGRFLRKTSLDELPQLWNVLRGDMSLVGPRPMMVHQKPMYTGRAYYILRPGITGSWQVSDRNETSFADRARYDREYHAGLSLRGDLSILGRTVAVVLRGTGY
ncbi:sugar transferase [Psychromarinibacter sp. S121]|uniref:sugar transferase n=1 Tax=Psychromarinibacter sp. S121 TaxID=3415127 RepID=UPI003C7A3BCD